MAEAYFTVMASMFFICIAIMAAITIGRITVWIFVKAYQAMCDMREKRIEKMMDKYFDEENE